MSLTPMIALDAATGERYLESLRALLTIARPGALFPEAFALREWLELFSRTTPKGLRVKLVVHSSGGFPAARTLERFHTLQRVARTVLAGARPSRAARTFSAALLNVELPPLARVEARLVGKARGVERFTVVYDTLDVRTGCPTRFTAQVEQSKARLVKVERGDQARVSPAFARKLIVSCAGRAEDALVALRSIDGLAVPEVVRAQLGPYVSRLGPLERAPARDVEALRGVVAPGEGVLSMLLDRAGETVTRDRDTDPWQVHDGAPGLRSRRAAAGYRVSLERRLVCTPGVEPAVRALVAGNAIVVRSR